MPYLLRTLHTVRVLDPPLDLELLEKLRRTQHPQLSKRLRQKLNIFLSILIT